MQKKIGELKKLTKDELIIECKELAVKINELKKEIKEQRRIWANYYRGKSWREEHKKQ